MDEYKAKFKLASETNPQEMIVAKFHSTLKFSPSFQRKQANRQPSKSFVIGLKFQSCGKGNLGMRSDCIFNQARSV